MLACSVFIIICVDIKMFQLYFEVCSNFEYHQHSDEQNRPDGPLVLHSHVDAICVTSHF